jgi:sialate O-acetylesterase
LYSLSRVLAPLAIAALVSFDLASVRADDSSTAVHHVVLYQFHENVSPEESHEISTALSRLAESIPGVRGFQWGKNNSPEGLSQGYTHAYLLTFQDAASRDAYSRNEAYQRFAERALPRVKSAFVYDAAVPEPVPTADPGRTHHLVFFKYKPEVGEAERSKIVEEFRGLEKAIPGLLGVWSGTDVTPEIHKKGYAHLFWLTFTNERARSDYLTHPAHQKFVEFIVPQLEEPLVVDFTVAPSSRSLFVTHGLEPYAVYQRGADGTATLRFGGVSAINGAVEARLRTDRRTVDGFDWKSVGTSRGGEFEAAIERVPTGGEYTVDIRIRDRLGNVAEHTEVADLLVGDLWILAGQSNMEGVGDLIDVEEPHTYVHNFTMAHRWELAVEPLHWLVDSPDVVHSGGMLRDAVNEEGRRAIRARARESRRKGAGLGLAFGKELVRRTGVPVGLIAAAHGGTSMAQWDPQGRDRGGETLYGSMLKQVRNAGGRVKGVLWYQGESDTSGEAMPLFAERLKGLVAALRADFGAELPFLYVQIGRFVVERPAEAWNAIQELQRVAESEIPGVAMASVIDLPLDDLIHVSTSGLARTGVRLAKLAHRDVFGNRALERGPRPAKVVHSAADRTIRVEFSGVNGSLLPLESIHGFSLAGADGVVLPLIYDAKVDPAAKNVVILRIQNAAPAGAKLWYGRGLDPVCNLVDEEDFAAPVFGPLSLE